MAKRSGIIDLIYKPFVKTSEISNLEIDEIVWYLPGNPINTDSYPWVHVPGDHDLLKITALAKTAAASGTFSCNLQYAEITGNSVGAFTTISTITLATTHRFNSSNINLGDRGPGVYRLLPTTVPATIQNITIAVQYRRQVVTKEDS